jgi:hypothetical protein
MRPEEERWQNLQEIIQATHTLQADLDESLDRLNALGVGLPNESRNTRRTRDHRNLGDVSATLAELQQRINDSLTDSLEELRAAREASEDRSRENDNPEVPHTTRTTSDSPRSTPETGTGRHEPASQQTPQPSLDVVQSILPGIMRAASLFGNASQRTEAGQETNNLGLALHFVSNSGAPSGPAPRPDGSEQLRPALARLSTVLGRRAAPPPGSDPASTSLGRRVAARAAAGSRNATADPASGATATPAPQPPASSDEGLLGDLHIFIMPMSVPSASAPAAPEASSRREPGSTEAASNEDPQPSRGGALHPTRDQSDMEARLRTIPSAGSPFFSVFPTSREEGGDPSSWPPRRRRGSSFEENVETSEGRTYQIRRRLNADGDEYVHQIPRRQWLSGRQEPDTVQSRATRGFFPLTYAALGEDSRQQGSAADSPATAEPTLFNSSLLDLPSTLNEDARAPALPISIRRRRSGNLIHPSLCPRTYVLQCS